MPVWEVIAQLERLGSTCQQALARSMATNPSRISRLLDGLEKDGTVARQRDRFNRRKVTVGLTAAGRARFRRMRPLVLRAMERTLAPLGPNQRRRLADLLLICVSS
jgi:DNA-binding MarR family transcriptional regulator